MRSDLTVERTRYWLRMEKLLEDSLIKVTAVSSRLTTASIRDMIEALIAKERDPRVLAELARGRMRAKIPALVEALTGRFDDHHAELATMLLAQIDGLDTQIAKLTTRIEQLLEDLPAAQAQRDPDDSDVHAGPDDHLEGAAISERALSAVERLDDIPGISPAVAHVILAEVGLDMKRFPTAGHLVSWAKLSPRTIQSGAKNPTGGRTGKGNPYLKGILGQAAAVASRTDSFLGERYRRIVKRRGKLKALVAVARSILVIIWHLLADPATRYFDLGADYHANRVDKDKKIRTHVRQLEALGLTVTLTSAA
jgi:transposase